MIDPTPPPSDRLTRVQQPALLIGVVSAGICVLGFFVARQEFFRSYLASFALVYSVVVGCLAITMLQHLIPAVWGKATRRVFATAAGTMPLLALMFVPLLFGLHDLFPFYADTAEANRLLQHKALYLNETGFVVRACVYFVLWIGFALLINFWSSPRNDKAPYPSPLRVRRLSAAGLLVLGLTASFANIDWLMALEPMWFSSIFPAVIGMGGLLAGMAAVVAVVPSLFADRSDEQGWESNSADLGCMLLTFLMLWTYMAFSQFLLIWSGNLPEEISWYLHRLQGGWYGVGVLIVLFHFIVPFVLLFSRELRRRLRVLAVLGGGLLFMRYVALWWTVAPTFSPGKLSIHWLDVAAPLALGGIWLGVFVTRLKQLPAPLDRSPSPHGTLKAAEEAPMSQPHDPHGGHPNAHRHEHSDASAAGVAKFVVGLSLVVIGVLFLMMWVQDLLRTARVTPREIPPQEIQRRETPPAPHLSADPGQQLESLRSEEDARLNHYGWADEQKKQARIPIERAMELIVERGLPAPPTREKTHPPANAEKKEP